MTKTYEEFLIESYQKLDFNALNKNLEYIRDFNIKSKNMYNIAIFINLAEDKDCESEVSIFEDYYYNNNYEYIDYKKYFICYLRF